MEKSCQPYIYDVVKKKKTWNKNVDIWVTLQRSSEQAKHTQVWLYPKTALISWKYYIPQV